MSGRLTAIGHLVYSRIVQFQREPEAVFWTYAFPLLMLGALGLAFRGEPIESAQVDVVGARAAEIEELLTVDRRIKIARPGKDEWKRRLQSGETQLVIDTDAPDHAVWWHEPRRPESVMARQMVENALMRAELGEAAPLVVERKLDEVGGRYVDFLLPGLIGMNLMGGGMWGIGFVLVDMRVRKLLKRYLATPMRKSDFLLSVMLSRLAFTLIDMVFLLAFGWIAFGVVSKGAFWRLAIAMTIGGASFAGIGLLVASRAKTIDAISGLMNLIMLPMWIASGVFFSAENFPAFLQPIIQAMPLTCLVNVLRGVMLDGDSLLALWRPLAILIAWGVGSFAIALKIFRWER